MRPITYSWIGLSAASPLIFLMCAWVLSIFHSYRRYWRSVDLFLLAMFVQELIMALQVFTFALLSLMKPDSGIACSVFVWSLSATRTLQAGTATSLLVDRALTSQWPYKYRFSVRRHQIRYHLVVLATMAALVGVAAILARPSDAPQSFDECSFLPHNLHVRLALFLLSLYGILIVISAVSIAVVQTMRGCKGGSGGPDPLDMAPIALGTTGSSTTTSSGRTLPGRPLHPATSSVSTASSTSSGRVGEGLQSASSTTDLVTPPLRPHHARNAKPHNKLSGFRNPAADFRWRASLVVTGLSFMINHLPYMCLLIIGTFFPTLMPDWPMENLALWLSLSEGLLLPLLLGLSDRTFSDAAVSSCAKEKPPMQKYDGGEAPFRLFPKDEVKAFPLTNGSLFSSILNMNVDAPMTVVVPSYRRPKHKGNSVNAKMGISAQEIRGLVGGGRHNGVDPLKGNFGRLFYASEGSTSLSCNNSQDAIYSDPLNKACSSSIDSSLKHPEEDHIYATLSETFGSLSSLSDGYLAEHHRCSSATTVANDDFEYHGPKPQLPDIQSHRHHLGVNSCAPEFVSACNLALTSRTDNLRPPEPPQNEHERYSGGDGFLNSLTESSASSSFRSISTDETCNSTETEKITDSNTTLDRSPFVTNTGSYVNNAFVNDSNQTKLSIHQPISILCNKEVESFDSSKDVKDSTLSRKHRTSSLSMNDLDQLDPKQEDDEEEMMFILPVKSESMLSLYRLYLAEDDSSSTGTSLHYSVDISRSENDLSAIPSPIDTEDKKVDSSHEIYLKKRPPPTAGSRVKRQSKIQRAKGVQQRSRPKIRKNVNRKESNANYFEGEFWKKETVKEEGLKLAVRNKGRRRNGIITIKDPSVLSVEELFKVLNRASKHSDIINQISGVHKESTMNTSQPTTEYKKIFVSEYL